MLTENFPPALTSALFSTGGFNHLVWLPPLPSSARCSGGRLGCGESGRSPPEGPASMTVFTSDDNKLVRCSGMRATRNLQGEVAPTAHIRESLGQRRHLPGHSSTPRDKAVCAQLPAAPHLVRGGQTFGLRSNTKTMPLGQELHVRQHSWEMPLLATRTTQKGPGKASRY